MTNKIITNVPHRTIIVTETRSLEFPITRDYCDKNLNELSNEELLQIGITLYSVDRHILVNEDYVTSSVTFTVKD